MKNEIVQEAHFYQEDLAAMYNYIEAIKTLNFKPEVELGLSRSVNNTYVFRVTALKPVVMNEVYVDGGSVTFKPGANASVVASTIISAATGSKI